MTSAHILIVDDEPDIRNLISDILKDEGYSVSTAANGEEANQQLALTTPHLILLDIWMPDIDGISLMKSWFEEKTVRAPIVMMSGHGTVETAVEATRLGAKDFIEKPLSLAKLLQTVADTLENHQVEEPEVKASIEVVQEPIGNSSAINDMKEGLSGIYTTSNNVLIYGDSGVGKSHLAQLIHYHRSGDSQSPLICVDCSSMEEDFEQTLCSHPQGAFVQAQGGHLVLTNLDLLSDRQQAALLSLLKSGSFLNQNGQQEMSFRILTLVKSSHASQISGIDSELLQMLAEIKLYVPALHERSEDIPELINHFVNTLPDEENTPYRKLSFAAQNLLRNHLWNNNLTQLKNTVRHLLLNGSKGDVELHEVENLLKAEESQGAGSHERGSDWYSQPLREAREAFEKAYLIHHLKDVGGRVGELAKVAGMERTHLYRKLRALNINPKNIDEES